MNNKIPIAALMSVFTVILVEIIFFAITEPLTGLPVFQPTSDDAVVVAKRELFSRAGGKVAIVGDSSSMHGISPKVLQQSSHLEYINLGTLASLTTLGYVQMAIELMDSDEPPLAIVIALLPQTLEIDESRAREMGQLGRFMAAYGVESPEVFNLSIKDYWKWLINKHRFNVFPQEFGGSFVAFKDLLSKENGYLLEKKTEIRRSKLLGEFAPSALSVKALELLFKEAARHRMPVVFVFDPKPRSLMSDAYVASVESFMSDMILRHPRVGFYNANIVAWDDRYFGTETHLSGVGSEFYSSELASQLDLLLGRE